ncbi:unnamed protein product [Acanthoscelides obtectus]|uniref:Ribosomal protein eL8/eL30/eS12/Gadd45 domain-containing protein n=1 Tax=Acanthoscelides obtectus TaxID=200917 RepID=A0A9P0QCH6_ACAOB|nr:unnamed protein product [Acanthoscelides obtectus]CAK1664324.1 hypothetical protein AOBTE_LOCUS24199 [Acanthoscelides obtectus]
METPILNKKQQKQSLSAKKSRPKETIKNVLSTPYAAYWPQISSPEDNSFLKQVLETNLPKIRVETAKIPWRELKHLKKPERREFRRQKTSGQEVDKKECEGLKLGVNAVTKLLESNTATAVLIAGDVQPRLMVQHIIDNAVLYKTPILIFAQLRDTLKDRCGVSSACIAISKNLPSESKLILVKEVVETIFMKCPPPINHINYKRALDSISSETGNVTKESQKPKKLKLDEAIEKTLCLEEVRTKKITQKSLKRTLLWKFM